MTDKTGDSAKHILNGQRSTSQILIGQSATSQILIGQRAISQILIGQRARRFSYEVERVNGRGRLMSTLAYTCDKKNWRTFRVGCLGTLKANIK